MYELPSGNRLVMFPCDSVWWSFGDDGPCAAMIYEVDRAGAEVARVHVPWLDAEPTVQSAHAPVDVPGDAALVSRATCRGNWSMQTPYRALPRASIAGERAVARDDARSRAGGRGGGGGDHDDGATTAAVAWASAGAAVVALLALAALAVALWRRKRRQKEIRALSLAIESDVMMGAAERAVLGSPMTVTSSLPSPAVELGRVTPRRGGGGTPRLTNPIRSAQKKRRSGGKRPGAGAGDEADTAGLLKPEADADPGGTEL